MNDETMRMLLNSLKYMRSLEKLEADFTMCLNVTSNGLTRFEDTCICLDALKDLRLSFEQMDNKACDKMA